MGTTGQKPKDVKSVFSTLAGVASMEVSKTGKFVIPQIAMLKLKHKPATPAGKRMMFGKEVKIAAMKASKRVKAFPRRPSRTPSSAIGAAPWSVAAGPGG